MNAEIINELKTIYREHLFTDEGKRQIKQAIELKKEWDDIKKKTHIQTETVSVKPNFVPKFLRDRMTCIEITPIGLNNMCYLTSELFEKKRKDVKKVFGFNLTACPCGRYISLEPHSVNKIGNTLYDFTKDFNNEKSKYFVEVDTKLSPREYIQLYGNNPYALNQGCICRIKWNNLDKYELTEKKMENIFITMKNIVVW
jgi:hypothetical protein